MSYIYIHEHVLGFLIGSNAWLLEMMGWWQMKSPYSFFLFSFFFFFFFIWLGRNGTSKIRNGTSLIKSVHCFIIKIVHCFLPKLFLAFCIKLFFVQHYLKNCSHFFLHKLFSVHCINCSLFSHKTPSEIMFSKFKSQIWMLFHVWISQ